MFVFLRRKKKKKKNNSDCSFKSIIRAENHPVVILMRRESDMVAESRFTDSQSIGSYFCQPDIRR